MPPLIDLVLRHGLALVFALTLLARAGAPVPAAPLLVVAGALAADGRLGLAPLLAIAVAANVLGDAVWYAAGRRHGWRVLGLLCRISLSPDSCVRQGEALVARWGGRSLVAAKFVPGVSVIAAPMVGAVGMSLARFIAWDVLAGLVWSGLFAGLGMVFRRQVDDVLLALSAAGRTAAVVLAGGVLAFAGWRWYRRRRFLRRSTLPRVSVQELQARIAGGRAPLILDVRSAATAALDPRRLPGARLVAPEQVEAFVAGLAGVGGVAGLAGLAGPDIAAGQRGAGPAASLDIVTYCNCPNEASAVEVAGRLRALGLRRVQPLAGGIDGWEAAGLPVERHEAA